MNRIETILLRARDTLADPSQERWTNERLLRILDEAQKSICRKFDLLHGVAFIDLEVNKVVYTLPDDVWVLTRITYDQKVLPMYSYQQFDRTRPGWEAHTGNRLEAVVYNLRNTQELRVYPIPNDSFPFDYYDFQGGLSADHTQESGFGVLTDAFGYDVEPDEGVVSEGVPLNTGFGVTGTVYLSPEEDEFTRGRGEFGVTTEFGAAASDEPFGVLAELSVTPGDTVVFDSVYGVAAEVSTSPQLMIQYIRDPATLNAASIDLELPPMFDTAVKHYIVGHAFLDDLDTQYQQRAAAAIALYEDELKSLGHKAEQLDTSTMSTKPSSTYKGFI